MNLFRFQCVDRNLEGGRGLGVGVLNFHFDMSVWPEVPKIGAQRTDQFEVLELKFDQTLGLRTELNKYCKWP